MTRMRERERERERERDVCACIPTASILDRNILNLTKSVPFSVAQTNAIGSLNVSIYALLQGSDLAMLEELCVLFLLLHHVS
jgi:hypothetical protein